jgi:hypothetical protein
MIGEILYLLSVFSAAIALLVRFGFLRGFLSKVLGERILYELTNSLKVSTPNLKSTFDGNNSASL